MVCKQLINAINNSSTTILFNCIYSMCNSIVNVNVVSIIGTYIVFIILRVYTARDIYVMSECKHFCDFLV